MAYVKNKKTSPIAARNLSGVTVVWIAAVGVLALLIGVYCVGMGESSELESKEDAPVVNEASSGTRSDSRIAGEENPRAGETVATEVDSLHIAEMKTLRVAEVKNLRVNSKSHKSHSKYSLFGVSLGDSLSDVVCESITKKSEDEDSVTYDFMPTKKFGRYRYWLEVCKKTGKISQIGASCGYEDGVEYSYAEASSESDAVIDTLKKKFGYPNAYVKTDRSTFGFNELKTRTVKFESRYLLYVTFSSLEKGSQVDITLRDTMANMDESSLDAL